MSPAAQCYYELMIRAVSGNRPAMCVPIADEAKLIAMSEQLARAERVADLFAHKGYAKAGDPIDKTAASLPLPLKGKTCSS